MNINGHQYFASYNLLLKIFISSNRADDHKQQQQMQNQEETGTIPAPAAASSATAVADQDQRKVLKFGFSAKGSTLRVFTSFCC